MYRYRRKRVPRNDEPMSVDITHVPKRLPSVTVPTNNQRNSVLQPSPIKPDAEVIRSGDNRVSATSPTFASDLEIIMDLHTVGGPDNDEEQSPNVITPGSMDEYNNGQHDQILNVDDEIDDEDNIVIGTPGENLEEGFEIIGEDETKGQ